MKVLSVVIALVLFSSMFGIAGAFEAEEKPYLLGEFVGMPFGLCCFVSPPWVIRACALISCFQVVIGDVCALLVRTVTRYVSLYMIPSVYDFVDTVLPMSPERSFAYIIFVLSCLKGFFDGAWRLGRLSMWRFCMSPAGKVINSLLVDMSMEGYYKRAELIEKGIPVRDIE